MDKTILVVDDFENTRFIIKMTLEKKGYRVIEAEHGKEALTYLDGRKLNLIITDLNMPEMDGIEFTEAIRGNARYGRLPVLMLTTEISEKKKANARSAGITGWIKKPFDISSFLKAVEKVL
ncbi:response regulator [Rapidithrix thailandica]|uniref:Response regulator n=1 Tax=Rapidithrix thailandica TaxID=413964 RepID=A0AAW9SG11_9BACT